MVPLSIRLILETNKKQNALKVLARLKKLVVFEVRGSRHTSKVGLRQTLLPTWMLNHGQASFLARSKLRSRLARAGK
jgi:hypothetical protein